MKRYYFNKLRNVAGACFAFCTLMQIINMIFYGYGWYRLWNMFYITGFALLAVSMFASKRVLAAIGSGLCAVMPIRYIIIYAGYSYWDFSFYAVQILMFSVWALLLVAALVPKAAKVLGIIAAGIATMVWMNYIVGDIRSIVNGYMYSGYVRELVFSNLLYPAIVVGALMFGLSVTSVRDDAAAPHASVTDAGGFDEQTRRLNELRALLDSGAITQEEFEEMKRQALGR